MASDHLVTASAILTANREIERLGPSRALETLEQVEPDLAEHLMESMSDLHQRLFGLGGQPKKTQAVFRRAQRIALECIGALRIAHYQLWSDSDVGRSLTPPTPPEDDRSSE